MTPTIELDRNKPGEADEEAEGFGEVFNAEP